MSAILERVAKQLSRLGSELSSLGIEEASELSSVARDLEVVEGILVTPAIARLVEEIASSLSRFSSNPSPEGVKELARELRSLIGKWVPKCVRASSILKSLVTIYSLSLVTLSVVATLVLAPSSVPSDVATLFTIFVCSVAIFGVLLGMNMMLLILPALSIAPLAQCASLAPSSHVVAWACMGIAVSLVASIFITMYSVRSYRRALLALLSISSSVDTIVEKLRSSRAVAREEAIATEAPRIEEKGVAEELRELPADIYGVDASELAKYSEEMKKLR